MRAVPLCAASQLLRRCGFVMPLCRLTTVCSSTSGESAELKRALKRSSSCGVRLISGTITKAWACGSAASSSCTHCKYTSVLPLPVAPNSKNGPGWVFIWASTVVCSAVRAWVDVPEAVAGPVVLASPALAAQTVGLGGPLRFKRRAIWVGLSSRSCGGRHARATSPTERW